MKYLKMLGLLAMAAAVLMALAASASATSVLTSPAGTAYTGAIETSAVETLTLKASVFTATCTVSEVNVSLSTNDSVHAEGGITKLHFTSCDSKVVTLSKGSLTVSDNGEVLAKNNEVTVEKFGTSCIYGGAAAGTKIGTLTAGTTANLTVAASLPKKTGSGALCAANATWTGKYTVTIPDTLLIT